MQDSALFSPPVRAGWFEWLPVALGAGILLYTLLPEEPSLTLPLLLLPTALALLWSQRYRPRARLAAAYLLTALLGFLAASFQTARLDAPMLQEPLFVEKMEGEILAIIPDEHRLSLRLHVHYIEGLDPARQPEEVRMSLRGKHTGLHVGDIIEVRGKLYPPSPPLIPGGYDFARHFFFRQIGGMGYILPPYKILSRAADHSALYSGFAWLQQQRYQLENWLLTGMRAPANGLAVAFITGDTLSLNPKTETALRGSGLTHILSISGMHMAIVCGLFFVGLRLMFAAIPYAALRWPIKKLSAALALLAGALYLLLSDFPVSAVRAYVMIFFFFLGVLLDRQALTLRSLAWAALVILLVQPSSLFEAGFQLSFIATLALVVYYREAAARLESREEAAWWQKPGLYVMGIITSSLVASLSTAPFVAAYFNVFNAYGVLANLISLPLMSFLIMPALIFALLVAPFGIAAPFLAMAAYGIDWMVSVAAWVTALPGANWYVAPTPDWALLLIAGGILFLLLGTPRYRWFGALPILAALATSFAYTQPDILIEREMSHIALRQPDGQWWLWRGRSNRNFTVKYWQTQLGETMQVWKFEELPGMFCTRQGCNWKKNGVKVVLPWKPEYLAEHCDHVDLVITRFREVEEACKGSTHITPETLNKGGSAAVFMEKTGPRLVYSCGGEAHRPWSGCRPLE